jgi:branched-chain amino acid transport system permease protein
MSDYIYHLLILFCLYAVTAQGLNIVFGLGGQFNLAHIAFFSVGSYATALLSTDLGWQFSSCLLVSILLPGLFALLVGEISLRLDKDYFAMATLSFAAIVSSLEINWKSLTRGVLGVSGIPRPEIMQIDFSDNANFLILSFIFFVIAQVAAYLIFRSKFARSLQMLALDLPSAEALGRDARQLRNLAFLLSACFAGGSGSLFAYYLNYIDPSSFFLPEMVLILTICIVAKPGSFWGIFPATLVLVILIPEGLRFVDMPSSVLGPLRQMCHALILFFVVLIFRHSLFPKRREV